MSLRKAKLPGKGLQGLSTREESQLVASVCLGSPSQTQALETVCLVFMTALSKPWVWHEQSCHQPQITKGYRMGQASNPEDHHHPIASVPSLAPQSTVRLEVAEQGLPGWSRVLALVPERPRYVPPPRVNQPPKLRGAWPQLTCLLSSPDSEGRCVLSTPAPPMWLT